MTNEKAHPASDAGLAPWHPKRVADLLNERFVALARLLDGVTRQGERLWGSKAPEKTQDPAASEGQRRREIVRRAQVRLSELHLHVGEKVYQLDADDEVSEAVARQLCALLEEIDRLEDVLRRIEGQAEDGLLTHSNESDNGLVVDSGEGSREAG